MAATIAGVAGSNADVVNSTKSLAEGARPARKGSGVRGRSSPAAGGRGRTALFGLGRAVRGRRIVRVLDDAAECGDLKGVRVDLQETLSHIASSRKSCDVILIVANWWSHGWGTIDARQTISFLRAIFDIDRFGRRSG